MKSDSEIAYIFIRYVTVTLKRKADDFYKKQEEIFLNECYGQPYSKEIIEQIQLQKVTFLTPEEFLDKKLQSERLLINLYKLTEEERFILQEKYLENQSDKNIGKTLNYSSQFISKKRRKIYTKLKELLFS